MLRERTILDFERNGRELCVYIYYIKVIYFIYFFKGFVFIGNGIVIVKFLYVVFIIVFHN